MKCALEKMSSGPGVATSLDGVCLSTRDRERAQAQLRKADVITNIVIRTIGKIRAAAAWLERAATRSSPSAGATLVRPRSRHV